MSLDLYLWHAPRDLDGERATALVDAWHAAGGDPAASPFEPSTDVGWLVRELRQDAPDLEIVTDAAPRQSGRPIWLEGENEAPARLAAIRLPRPASAELLELIYSLATKYDLVLFDRPNGRLHQPLAEMAAHASATFWPAGAIQAGVVGLVGALIAVVAWLFDIPVLSGILILVGGFLALGAVYSFFAEARHRARSRKADPPG